MTAGTTASHGLCEVGKGALVLHCFPLSSSIATWLPLSCRIIERQGKQVTAVGTVAKQGCVMQLSHDQGSLPESIWDQGISSGTRLSPAGGRVPLHQASLEGGTVLLHGV